MSRAFGLLLWALAASPLAEQPDCGIPPTREVAPFVGRDGCLRAIEYADLNRDGIVSDAVLILERRNRGRPRPTPTPPGLS